MTKMLISVLVAASLAACKQGSEQVSPPQEIPQTAQPVAAGSANPEVSEASPPEPEPPPVLVEPLPEPDLPPEPEHLREALPAQKIDRVLHVRTQLTSEVGKTITHHKQGDVIYYYDRYDHKEYGADTDTVETSESHKIRVECGFGVQLDRLRTFYQVRVLSEPSGSNSGGFNGEDEIFSKCLFLRDGDEVHVVKHTKGDEVWYTWRLSTESGSNEGDLK